jgi:GNAT superfamily N-acetyltransferase
MADYPTETGAGADGAPGGFRMEITIKAAVPAEYRSALDFYFQRETVADRKLLVQEKLDAHRDGVVSLEHMLVAHRAGRTLGVMLVQRQPDNSAFFWLPVVADSPDAETAASGLVRAACHSAERNGVSSAQVILPPEELHGTELLLAFKFSQLAEISYLQRSLDDPIPPLEGKCSIVPFEENVNRDRFARLLESTFEGTLDCPSLASAPDGSEALVSHQFAGIYTPERWMLFEVDGDDVGLLLINDHPEQSAWEIVYMGVSPRFRGRGYGRTIVVEGLRNMADCGRDSVLLAVDRNNHFASDIYEEMGFFPIANRTVFLRTFGEAAAVA